MKGLEYKNGLGAKPYVQTRSGVSLKLDAADAFTEKYIETGTYSSSASKGITLSSTNNRPVSFLFDDADAAMTGDIRGVLSRVAVVANHTGALTLDAIRGQVKFVGGIDYDADYAAGVRGYVEIAGATDFALNSAGHAVSALHGRVEIGGNVSVETANTYLAGLYLELNTTGAYTVTQTGVLAGVVIEYTDQKNDKWGYGLYIGNTAVDTDLRLQNGETIDNATNGAVQVTSGVLKHAVDAAAYWTATQADGGGVTFASTSDGTAGFTFSQAVTLSSDLGVAGTLDVDSSISGGASNGHLIKKTNPAGETYSGTEAALTIKHYDADNTVVHGSGENAGLAVFFKPQSDSATGGENVIATFHKYAGATGTIKHGAVVYGDMTNVFTGSGGTATTALQFENETALTNLFGIAAAGASSPAVGSADASGDVEGSIAITVGGVTKYLHYWPNAAS